jgi:hypothetical protein
MVTKLTDAMVAIEGEAMRQVTWDRRSEERPLGARRQAADHRRREGDASQQSRLIGQIVLG